VSWRVAKRERQRYARWVQGMVERWAELAVGIGLVRRSVSAGGLPVAVTPAVEWVDPGPPVRLVVRMLAGQMVSDYDALVGRIAAGMGAAVARVAPDRPGSVAITLLSRDPLSDPVPVEWHPAIVATSRHVVVGVDEDGRAVEVDFTERVHLLVQGRTGSGKSRLSYGIVQQLAADPQALIAGCDPSSVLLRPFRGSRHAPWQVLGDNPVAHAELLERLGQEMQQRLGAIPKRCDVLPVSAEYPMVFVVLEEWLGVLNLAGSDKKLRERLATGVRRLATESGKVGMRLIMLVQRAEATEMGGALVRSQFAHRLSLPVDNLESIRLLHPTVPTGLAEAHIRCGQAGFALYEGPGREVGRLRTPWVGDYGSYWDAITTVVNTNVNEEAPPGRLVRT
jgi:hypothetical protein